MFVQGNARYMYSEKTQWISREAITKIDFNDCQTMILDNFLYFVVKNIKEIMYVVRPRAGTILRAL